MPRNLLSNQNRFKIISDRNFILEKFNHYLHSHGNSRGFLTQAAQMYDYDKNFLSEALHSWNESKDQISSKRTVSDSLVQLYNGVNINGHILEDPVAVRNTILNLDFEDLGQLILLNPSYQFIRKSIVEPTRKAFILLFARLQHSITTNNIYECQTILKKIILIPSIMFTKSKSNSLSKQRERINKIIGDDWSSLSLESELIQSNNNINSTLN